VAECILRDLSLKDAVKKGVNQSYFQVETPKRRNSYQFSEDIEFREGLQHIDFDRNSLQLQSDDKKQRKLMQ
jgi:hypothetical protein